MRQTGRILLYMAGIYFALALLNCLDVWSYWPNWWPVIANAVTAAGFIGVGIYFAKAYCHHRRLVKLDQSFKDHWQSAVRAFPLSSIAADHHAEQAEAALKEMERIIRE